MVMEEIEETKERTKAQAQDVLLAEEHAQTLNHTDLHIGRLANDAHAQLGNRNHNTRTAGEMNTERNKTGLVEVSDFMMTKCRQNRWL
eukprot:UN04432